MSDFNFDGGRPPQEIAGLPGVYIVYPPKPSSFDVSSSAALFTITVLPGSPSYEDAKRAKEGSA